MVIGAAQFFLSNSFHKYPKPYCTFGVKFETALHWYHANSTRASSHVLRSNGATRSAHLSRLFEDQHRRASSQVPILPTSTFELKSAEREQNEWWFRKEGRRRAEQVDESPENENRPASVPFPPPPHQLSLSVLSRVTASLLPVRLCFFTPALPCSPLRIMLRIQASSPGGTTTLLRRGGAILSLRLLTRRMIATSTLRRTSSASAPAPAAPTAAASAYFLPRNTFRTFSTNSPSRPDRLLVVGSGVAGSAAALIAADTYQLPVTMVFAGNAAVDCNSYWAQGGIIYQGRPNEDSPELLASDIHRAGAGLCDAAAVDKVAQEGPSRVEQLLLRYAPVPFDRTSDGSLSLCLEASHTAPRILHTADHTGKSITQSLAAAVARHPLIDLRGHSVVVDLIRDHHSGGDSGAAGAPVVGVTTLDRRTGQLSNLYASSGVLLASGGLAGIYQHSTNPAGFNALGSSVALARRAGADLRDLEFVQFHPTALHIPQQPRYLLSEALRGEGAILRTRDGRAFAREYHPDGELAPRDVVARAVYSETARTGQVYLDLTHRDAAWVSRRFPSIQAHVQQYQLDLSRDWLPVTPAAHYTCGGIATDLHGRTSVPGLFAAGEAARTGLHGGNRLASTSLLEGLVFGASVADYCGTHGRNAHQPTNTDAEAAAPSSTSFSSSSTTAATVPTAAPHRRGGGATPYLVEPNHIEAAAHRALRLLRQIRHTMWEHVGLVRTPSGLRHALERLEQWQAQSEHWYVTCPTLETAAVRDAAQAGLAVAQAAWDNPVSAGAHYIVDDDHPAALAMAAASTTAPGDGAPDDSDEEEGGAVAAAR